MAILGVRLFAAGLIPCCIVNALKSYYQGTTRVVVTEVISFCEGALLPCLSALAMRAIFGLDGIWLHFAVGEALAVAGIWLYASLRGNKRGAEALLMLRPSFGVKDDDLMEEEIRTLEDVTAVSESAERFCKEHAQSALFAGRIAVCVEEMASNAVLYGFSPDGHNRMSVRIQYKDRKFTLRFRDDCPAFNPLSYIPGENSEHGLGIRIVSAMADDIHYTSSLNLNNLTIVLEPHAGD